MQRFLAGLPAESRGIVAEYENKFGEKRVIHRTRHGLSVLRQGLTVSVALTRVIGPLVGAKIRAARVAAGMSQTELITKAGLAFAGHPKQRMHEIEKGSRLYGLRFGTLYALAAALGCQPADLLPPLNEVLQAANIRCKRTVQVGLAVVD